MVIAFHDASALVKRYVPEDGADLMPRDSTVLVAAMSEVEVTSAIWRRFRLGDVSNDDAETLHEAVRADFRGDPESSPYSTIGLSTLVIDRALKAVTQHDLRAGYAIQLASALVARDALPECGAFAAFDVRLRNAARAEGFVLIPRQDQLS